MSASSARDAPPHTSDALRAVYALLREIARRPQPDDADPKTNNKTATDKAA